MSEIPSSNLLMCPFCGLQPDLIQANNDPSWWIVNCMHADCEVGPYIERQGRDKVIAAWNQRALAGESK